MTSLFQISLEYPQQSHVTKSGKSTITVDDECDGWWLSPPIVVVVVAAIVGTDKGLMARTRMGFLRESARVRSGVVVLSLLLLLVIWIVAVGCGGGTIVGPKPTSRGSVPPAMDNNC